MSQAEKSGDINEIIHQPNINSKATAVGLNGLDRSSIAFFNFGKPNNWIRVNCPDGTFTFILKNPDEAFELYGQEWSSKFNLVGSLIDKFKLEADKEKQNRIVKIFENLNYVDATLRELYKNSYLTFAAMPCNESAQKEKQRMDKIIAAIGLSLVRLRMTMEHYPGNDSALFGDVDGLIEKVIDILLDQPKEP